MRWKSGRRSENVEDRRGMRVPGGAKGLGLGALLVAVVAVLMGADPSKLTQLLGANAVADAGEARPASRADDELAQFVSVVLADTEDVWTELLSGYEVPKLVLFEDSVSSACGVQGAAVGPFYCPGDSRVYLDLSFFRDLSQKLGAPGDFAQAYVIAHEIGHHVQNLLGTSTEVHARKRGLSEAEANDLSVRLELQADFYAGVWAYHARDRGLLEKGDMEEALRAASSIGDDRLQRQSRGYVTPDSFTHGSSAQRVRWFQRGLETGDPARGDTFSARDL